MSNSARLTDIRQHSLTHLKNEAADDAVLNGHSLNRDGRIFLSALKGNIVTDFKNTISMLLGLIILNVSIMSALLPLFSKRKNPTLMFQIVKK